MQCDTMRGRIGTDVRRHCASAILFSGASDVR